ncbi:MAG: biotin transporter BioY [Planctomycetota bacterium]|jgi:biotin transport system substrate-specific component
MVADVPMIEALFPWAKKRTFASDCILVLAGSLLIGLCAKIKVPLLPVPVTMQTFAVLVIAALFGARRGAMTVLVYLLQGSLGLPVFAGKAGFLAFAGPTGGYLVGFIFAALLVGLLAEKGWDRKPSAAILAMCLGNLVIYAFGLLWLQILLFTGKVSLEENGLLDIGLYPFILGDILKIMLASCLLPTGWKLLQLKKRHES